MIVLNKIAIYPIGGVKATYILQAGIQTLSSARTDSVKLLVQINSDMWTNLYKLDSFLKATL